MKELQRNKTFFQNSFRKMIFMSCAIMISACVPREIYLQSALVEGPAQKYMVRVTKNSENEKATIRCQFSRNLETDFYVSSETASSSDSRVDQPDNLNWQYRQTIF